MKEKYQEINSKTIDSWCEDGWEWAIPVTHEEYQKALNNDYKIVLTPTKPVPKHWFGDLKGKKILGLASGGGQQMPIFQALGAICTVLDYSDKQLESERMVAKRENYQIEIIKADMSKPLPFEDESFDLIFHPVSNCYVLEVKPIFKECFRILKPGGALLAGLGNEINYIVNDAHEKMIVNKMPFNPLEDAELYELSMKQNDGIQFSHTLEEQIGGQLEAGFILKELYEDTNGYGYLHEMNIKTFIATYSEKPKR
jgi:ubiquinone/menaquinone biosynthesis C-methylase UbiE